MSFDLAKNSASEHFRLGIATCAATTLLLALTSTPAQAAKPVARNDSTSAVVGKTKTINVLGNDRGLSDTPIKVTLGSQPNNVTVSVLSNNRIRVQPQAGSEGKQTFTYQVRDKQGDTAVATVTLNVTCTSNCGQSSSSNNGGNGMTLQWNQGSQTVKGFRVYQGPSKTKATKEVFDVPVNWVTFDPTQTLGAKPGQRMCFRVKAYNDAGVSGYSSGVCATL